MTGVYQSYLPEPLSELMGLLDDSSRPPWWLDATWDDKRKRWKTARTPSPRPRSRSPASRTPRSARTPPHRSGGSASSALRSELRRSTTPPATRRKQAEANPLASSQRLYDDHVDRAERLKEARRVKAQKEAEQVATLASRTTRRRPATIDDPGSRLYAHAQRMSRIQAEKREREQQVSELRMQASVPFRSPRKKTEMMNLGMTVAKMADRLHDDALTRHLKLRDERDRLEVEELGASQQEMWRPPEAVTIREWENEHKRVDKPFDYEAYWLSRLTDLVEDEEEEEETTGTVLSPIENRYKDRLYEDSKRKALVLRQKKAEAVEQEKKDIQEMLAGERRPESPVDDKASQSWASSWWRARLLGEEDDHDSSVFLSLIVDGFEYSLLDSDPLVANTVQDNIAQAVLEVIDGFGARDQLQLEHVSTALSPFETRRGRIAQVFLRITPPADVSVDWLQSQLSASSAIEELVTKFLRIAARMERIPHKPPIKVWIQDVYKDRLYADANVRRRNLKVGKERQEQLFQSQQRVARLHLDDGKTDDDGNFDDGEFADSVLRLHCGTQEFIRQKILKAANKRVPSADATKTEPTKKSAARIQQDKERAWKELFARVDQDGGGEIQCDEFFYLIREELLISSSDVTDRDLNAAFRLISQDDDGISRDDWLEYLSTPAKHFKANALGRRELERAVTSDRFIPPYIHMKGEVHLDEDELRSSVARMHLGSKEYIRQELLLASEAWMDKVQKVDLPKHATEKQKAQALKRQKILAWNALFNKVDKDGGGDIDFKEFESLIREQLSIKKENMSRVEVQSLFDFISQDDDSVSKDDFIEYLSKPSGEFKKETEIRRQMAAMAPPDRPPKSPNSPNVVSFWNKRLDLNQEERTADQTWRWLYEDRQVRKNDAKYIEERDQQRRDDMRFYQASPRDVVRIRLIQAAHATVGDDNDWRDIFKDIHPTRVTLDAFKRCVRDRLQLSEDLVTDWDLKHVFQAVVDLKSRARNNVNEKEYSALTPKLLNYLEAGDQISPGLFEYMKTSKEWQELDSKNRTNVKESPWSITAEIAKNAPPGKPAPDSPVSFVHDSPANVVKDVWR